MGTPDITVMLEALIKPAFYVENGRITQVNTAAKQRMIQPDTDISSLFATGQPEYNQFDNGCLYLTLRIQGNVYECAVTHMEDRDLFIVESIPCDQQLQSMALAAEYLRLPLSDIGLAVNMMDVSNGPVYERLMQSLYKMQRLIGNMSDASYLMNGNFSMVSENLTAIFGETLEKAAVLLEKAGINLHYTLEDQNVIGLADASVLSRAIYNLISNAAKYLGTDKKIDAKLSRRGQSLLFTVTGGTFSGDLSPGNMFNRYTRYPGIEDSRNGIGLGITIVHAAASSHGGTVLVQQDQNGRAKVTMTISIEQNNLNKVRSTSLPVDIYGGKDAALVELSDVLPSSLYRI